MSNSEVDQSEVEKLEGHLWKGATFRFEKTFAFKLESVFLGILMSICSAAIGFGLMTVIVFFMAIEGWVDFFELESVEFVPGIIIGSLLGVICALSFVRRFRNILTIKPKGILWKRGFSSKALRFTDITNIECSFDICYLVLNDGKRIKLPINYWDVQSALPAATYIETILRYYFSPPNKEQSNQQNF